MLTTMYNPHFNARLLCSGLGPGQVLHGSEVTKWICIIVGEGLPVNYACKIVPRSYQGGRTDLFGSTSSSHKSLL